MASKLAPSRACCAMRQPSTTDTTPSSRKRAPCRRCRIMAELSRLRAYSGKRGSRRVVARVTFGVIVGCPFVTCRRLRALVEGVQTVMRGCPPALMRSAAAFGRVSNGLHAQNARPAVCLVGGPQRTGVPRAGHAATGGIAHGRRPALRSRQCADVRQHRLCADRLPARHAGRHPAGPRPRLRHGDPAARRPLSAGRRRHHHHGRHLLRRHVRRLHHRHPDEHPGRGRVRHHRPGRLRHDQAGPRGRGARHCRHRLLPRGHSRHPRHRLPGAEGRRPRAAFRAARIFRPGAVLDDDAGELRRPLDPGGRDAGRVRHVARLRRHRSAHRHAAAQLRHARADEGLRHRAGADWPLRHRRGAGEPGAEGRADLRGQARLGAVDDPARSRDDARARRLGARHGDRLRVRAAAGHAAGAHRLPLLRRGAADLAHAREVRHRHDRGRGGARGRQQRHRHGRLHPAARRSASPPRRRWPSCSAR